MAKLKELRTARGISQQDLAELLGVTRQTVSKWENEIVQPSADNLKRLSQVFQLPLEAFLKNDWTPPEQQAVEAAAVLPETPPDTDAESAATPAEVPPDTDAEPAAAPPEVPSDSVDEVPMPRRRNYRLWAALAAAITVISIIAGVISFNQRGDNVTPSSELERKEVDGIPTISATLQPLQP